jgi:hypothetical protein
LEFENPKENLIFIFDSLLPSNYFIKFEEIKNQFLIYPSIKLFQFHETYFKEKLLKLENILYCGNAVILLK